MSVKIKFKDENGMKEFIEEAVEESPLTSFPTSTTATVNHSEKVLPDSRGLNALESIRNLIQYLHQPPMQIPNTAPILAPTSTSSSKTTTTPTNELAQKMTVPVVENIEGEKGWMEWMFKKPKEMFKK